MTGPPRPSFKTTPCHTTTDLRHVHPSTPSLISACRVSTGTPSHALFSTQSFGTHRSSTSFPIPKYAVNKMPHQPPLRPSPTTRNHLSTRLPGALRPPAPVQLDFRMASRTTSGYLPTPTTSSPADRTSQYPPSHLFHPRRFPPGAPPRGTPQALPPSSRLPGQPTPAPRVRTPSPYSRPPPPLMFSSSSTPRSRCGHPTVAHPANPSANVQLRTSRRSR